MFNMNYKESEHMKEVRENYLEKVKEKPMKSFEDISDSLDKVEYSIEEKLDSERAYSKGYLEGQTDTMILTGVGLVLGCLLTTVINRLSK